MMRQLGQSLLRALVVLSALSGALSGAALAAEATSTGMTLLPDTDLPGADYRTLTKATLKTCEAACLADRLCDAFTFNQKSRWCFLKAGNASAVPFKGAVSGRIEGSPSRAETLAQREGALPFANGDLVFAAKTMAERLKDTAPPPEGAHYDDLVAAGDDARAGGDAAGAELSYSQALALQPNDPVLWSRLADASLARAELLEAGSGEAYSAGDRATAAAINAFLRAETQAEEARALDVLGDGLGLMGLWREAIRSYRASVAIAPDPGVVARLEKAVAEHGFRIMGTSVDAEAEEPRFCVQFSDPLPSGETDLSAYLSVADAPQAAIESDSTAICARGLRHGTRYAVTVRSGLPSADGETLQSEVRLDIYVPDRAPFVGFQSDAYVMPATLTGGVPITSINASSAHIALYRIGDRGLAATVRSGVFLNALNAYSAADVAAQQGEKLFEGDVDLAPGPLNDLVTTSIPVTDIMGAPEPGAYVLTARARSTAGEEWRDLATQWFIITDLGLSTVSGTDGLHAIVRQLSTAAPEAGVSLKLVAVNAEVLGEATTDAAGLALFDPGLLRGRGGRAPQMLVAETASGDYAFIDISRAAFDLGDRGVAGRPAPGPLDVYATTERGVYRPGETVFFTALLRDARANAMPGLPLTLSVERPDGVLAETPVLKDQGAGSYFLALPLGEGAMRGAWTLKLGADAEAPPLAASTILVEDFEPERLAFELAAAEGALQADGPTTLAVTARYLYGAVAPDLTITGDVLVRPVSTLKAYPGYVFGRLDDGVEPDLRPLGTLGVTDAEGKVQLALDPVEPPVTTRLVDARIILRLADASGRVVERSLVRPLPLNGQRIGLKPQFDMAEGVPSGSAAGFDVIVIGPDGAQSALAGLTYRLSRLDTTYQWYRTGDTWRWEPVTNARLVASGTLDALVDAPALVSVPVDWGRYRLEVDGADTSSSLEFDAGFVYAAAGADTPDTLNVALDKASYQVGDVAHLKLSPQFAGEALVMVVDDRVITQQAVHVPEGGLTVDLPVTDEWGAGAYVTATLFRPADAGASRMPARALGLDYADIDPGDRVLTVALTAPQLMRPKERLDVRVAVPNARPGEPVRVAVAVVDLGILSLTRFSDWNPEGWYFGQRQLGVELRDVYGRLIDPTLGSPGQIRSGGDGGGSRLIGAPPPTTVLVAQHSGVVEIGPDGTASVAFDMPDFTGTVRLMAMAWTPDAVGHAVADVVLRDPLVATLTPPRFLRMGDAAALVVELANVSGPAGDYGLAITGDDGLSVGALPEMVTLEQEARQVLRVPLEPRLIGDHDIRLVVTGPDGTRTEKSVTLGVEPVAGEVRTTRQIVVAAGESLRLDAGFADGLLPGTATLTASIGPLSSLHPAELLVALDRYPYGCAEQIVSRAMPLIDLKDVSGLLGLPDDDAVMARVAAAVTSLLGMQNGGGGFGLWGPDSGGSLWLDAMATEFLLRARDRGIAVPEQALSRALDSLSNQVAYASDFSTGGEDIAYALYDLARAGRAALGDLRYYMEAKLTAFSTPLARAQIGAALALYGDRTRAAAAFVSAVDLLAEPDDPARFRTDYGSPLRDAAAILALAAEARPGGVDLEALAARVAALSDAAPALSTQEQGWLLMAVAALDRSIAGLGIEQDGTVLTRGMIRLDAAQLASGVTLTNTGSAPVSISIGTLGWPIVPPEAEAAGFTISRDYYLPTGDVADLTALTQNDRLVVAITVSPEALGSGDYLVEDALPAGFEIENPNLTAGGGAENFGWLGVTMPIHAEARTDRFVGAYRFSSAVQSFTAAYLVRVTSPGTFALPGTRVEDMYRPQNHALQAAGTISIAPAGP